MRATNNFNISTFTVDSLPKPPERHANFPTVEHRRLHDAPHPQMNGAKALYRKLLQLLCCGASSVRQENGTASHAKLDAGITNAIPESGFQQSKARMLSLIESALIAPMPGEKQQPVEEAWAIVHQFDAHRLAGENCTDLLKGIADIDEIAGNENHPSCADAKLLKDIMTRPIGKEAPSLEKYLADKVQDGLYLPMKILPNPDSDKFNAPDSRTFNAMQPGLATSTLDYNPVCRTLLHKGATHLIGIPSSPTDTDDRLTKEEFDRKDRLQKTIFSFPKCPAEGVKSLELLDFDARIDPLDDLGIYESSGPQMS